MISGANAAWEQIMNEEVLRLPGYRMLGPVRGESRGESLRAIEVSSGALRRVSRPWTARHGIGTEAMRSWVSQVERLARLRCKGALNTLSVQALEDGLPLLVSEFEAGLSLEYLLEQHAPLTIGDAAGYAIAAAAAVSEAHAAGSFLNDLSLRRLWFIPGRGGEGHSLKLLDFGVPNPDLLAHLATGAFEQKLPDSPNSAWWRFLSPERLAGRKPQDARSEVWSLGVILFELLTVANPFGDAAASIPGLAAAIKRARPTVVSAIRLGVPAEIEELVTACLSPAPADRPVDLRAVVDRLAPFASGWALSCATRVLEAEVRPPARALARRPMEDAATAPRKPWHLGGSIRTVGLAALSILAAGSSAAVLLRPNPPPAVRPSRSCPPAPQHLVPPAPSQGLAGRTVATDDGPAPVVKAASGSTAAPEIPEAPQPRAMTSEAREVGEGERWVDRAARRPSQPTQPAFDARLLDALPATISPRAHPSAQEATSHMPPRRLGLGRRKPDGPAQPEVDEVLQERK